MNRNAKIGTDAHYYLKIVTSEYQTHFQGPQIFYEFSSHGNLVDRASYVPKVEFKYNFDPIDRKSVV